LREVFFLSIEKKKWKEFFFFFYRSSAGGRQMRDRKKEKKKSHTWGRGEGKTFTCLANAQYSKMLSHIVGLFVRVGLCISLHHFADIQNR
jgi:hypothetical protein